jgi:sugar O-acyltransferase (sialic acid O-acetyltransferase NeuD family)
MSKIKLIIIGAGNFAEEVLDVARESGFDDITCFVEGIDRNQCGKNISGVPIIWIDDISNYDYSHMLLCAIGSPKRKKLIEQIQTTGLEFTNVIHPTTRISSTVRMGKDIFVSVSSIIAAGCSLGDHVIINRAAVIGHHVNIENFVTISPGVNIGGGSSIGEGSYIGMGAIILDHISVGRNSIVGAGAVVTKNVPDNVQVVGIPAHITKIIEE